MTLYYLTINKMCAEYFYIVFCLKIMFDEN